MTETLHQPWSLRDLVDELRHGRTTPSAALARSRTRIHETEPHLHAWVERIAEPVAPAVVYGSGPLGGVPFGVKDIIDLAGVPTRCGSGLRASAAPAVTDAAIVSEWRSAGAVPVGKTVTTEFAFFAPGPTRNPAAPDRTPGGSSSGSAAAVAAGQVPLALGSQTAGSVTRPASYCGIASLVMSHGRFPVSGITGLSPSFDSHGVLAATVSDLALAWSALTGAADSGLRSSEAPAPRVLVWTADPLGVVGEGMRAVLERSAALLRAAGVTVDAFPDEQLVAEVTTAHPVLMAYEAARERSAELALADHLSQPLADLLRAGTQVSEHDRALARAAVAAGAERVARLLETYDVILGPAAPGPAPRGLETTGDPVLSRCWQALGLPTATVPGMVDEDGLPLGLQLVGQHGGEVELLRHACWVERVLAAAAHRYSGDEVR